MDLSAGVQRILDGEAVLFVGAGFSLGATNLRDNSFLSGQAIADHFAELAGLPKGMRLEDAADAYVDSFNVDLLLREVQEEFTAKDVCDYHRGVAALPWKRIYTTNYDNVFEVASRLERQRLTPVTMGHDVYNIPKDHRICVHLNGYVDGLDRSKILTELKLTDESYVTASVADSEWAMLFRQDIRLASAIFFIGYSLYDLDVKRILSEAEDTKEKLFFFLGPSPDDPTLRRASRYGSTITASTEDFVKLVAEIDASYIPRDKGDLRCLYAREITTPFPPARITDQSFRDLLLWGRRNENLVAESLRTNTTFYLYRSQTDQALDILSQGSRILVITSDLGNGKSMFLEGLRIRAIERGYRVFDLFDHNTGLNKEIEAIARSGQKVLVTIEEYQNWLDEIRIFCLNAGNQASIVATARNAVNDVLIDDLVEISGDKPVEEMNIDNLSEREIEWVVDALDQYGQWGTRAGLNRSQKQRYIVERCGRQIHAVLLNLLDSPDISQRISSVAQRLKAKGESYDILLSVFILTFLNHGPTLDVLTDIWGTERINTPQFRTDPIVKEIVSFNYYALLVRSPIAAEFILRSCSDPGTLVSVLIRIAERTEKGRNVSPRYRNIFMSLMRFGSVQALLPEKGRRNAIIEYYETIKNLDSCRSNPLFWLQYAIGSLVIEDLPRAKTYFDTAYSLAAKKEWDTYQIDNHFSRFLMVQAVKELDFRSALENYKEARTIIERQIRDGRRHYPYRVAINFQDFLSRFGARMDIPDLEDLVATATRILERIALLSPYRRAHRYVVECQKAMHYVVSVCGELINNRKMSKNGQPDAEADRS